MRHLLLIDNSIRDLAVFQAAINANTDSIVFDFASETLATLQTKLSAISTPQYEHVGLVQENGPSNTFLRLVKNQDFVQWIVDNTKCVALDLFTCNIMTDPKWKTTIKMIQTTFPQIPLGASINTTGNTAAKGDWIEETNGVNLKEIYLTDSIKNYKGTFGVNPYHSIIVDGSGGCYVAGDNSYGQLGLGLEYLFPSISPPERLTIPGKTITDVHVGYEHSVFLCSDGTVYSCGYNGNGELGVENTNNYYVPTRIDLDNIIAIACGYSHTLFLRSDGTVSACGYNGNGELGLGDNYANNYYSTVMNIPDLSNVIAIAAGDGFSMFLRSDGTVYGTGNNGNGQLGIGNTDNINVPTTISTVNFGSSHVAAIACGGEHTLFLCLDGTVYGCGYNGDGELGLDGYEFNEPTQIDSNYFSSGVGMIFCGYYNSFFVCTDGNVYGCGYNESSSLGLNNEDPQFQPTRINFFSNNSKIVNYIQASEYFTIFVCSDKSVYGCGDNTYGQVGDGSVSIIITPTLYSFSKTITSFTSNYENSLYLCSDGTVYSCGYGYYGALGLGNYDDVSALTQIVDISNVSKIAICKQNSSSIFLCNNETVYSCGTNYNGQLGLNDTTSRNIPTNVPDLSNITDIACGGYHVLYLHSNGSVYSCGSNGNGQLGQGNYTDSYVPIIIPSLSNVSKIAAGDHHSLFVCNDGSVYSCGYGWQGQLGLGNHNEQTIPTQISDVSNVVDCICSGYHSIILCSNGNAYGFGENGSGQLGIGNTTSNQYSPQLVSLSNITSIRGGLYHSLFLDGSGNVYGTGHNQYGQLGLNTEDQVVNQELYYTSILTPTQMTIGSNKIVSTIFTGYYNSMFICNDNTVYVCGENDYNHTFGLKYVDQYYLPNLATFQATIAAHLVSCFCEGTQILTLVGDEETYVPVENLVPGSIVKTYLHGTQVVKKVSKGSLYNNSEDPKKCMFKMEKSGNMTADLCLTGGHAILRDDAPKGLQFKIDDKYLHFVENLPEFKKMEARQYKYYNFCFENDGDLDLRFGVWANGVLCETPSEKQLNSFM